MGAKKGQVDYVELEEVEETEQEVTVESDFEDLDALNELSEEEQKMAEDIGIKKPAVKEEEPEDEKPQEEEKVEDKKEDVDFSKMDEKELDDLFEDLENDPDREQEVRQKMSVEQRGFYKKWKKANRAKQEAVAKAQQLEMRVKMLEAQEVKKPKDLDDLLTAEEQRAEKEKPITRAEFEAIENKKAQDEERRQAAIHKCNMQEKEFAAEHEDFYEAVEAAKTVFAKNPKYFDLYRQVAMDPDPEVSAADFIYTLGKRYMKPKEQKKNETVEKIINQKKQTSASLPASAEGATPRRIKYEDLTVEDAVRLSTADFAKLPFEVRKRLLSQL